MSQNAGFHPKRSRPFPVGVAMHMPLSLDVADLTNSAVSKALSASMDEEDGQDGTENDVFDFSSKTSAIYADNTFLPPTRKRSASHLQGGVRSTISRQATSDNAVKETDGLESLASKKPKVVQSKSNAAANGRRGVRRKEYPQGTNQKVIDKYVKGAPAIPTALVSEKLPTTSTAYTAMPDRSSKPSRDNFCGLEGSSGTLAAGGALESSNSSGKGPKEDAPRISSSEPSRSVESLRSIPNQQVKGVLEQLMQDDGFAYKAWNGTTSHPILDSLKRVVAVLVAKPNDPDYDNAARNVFKKMERLGSSSSFSRSETDHIRGRFPAINVGISLGPGGTQPLRVQVGGHEKMMQTLLDDENVQRLASLQNASFKLWAPRLYAHYESTVNRLLLGRPGKRSPLRMNFRSNVFASMAFNFPPQVRTIKHRDVRNLPYGMCAIHALGDFDHTAGGHLILWELKLIIEFPPGAMVLIPSATITHSNVPVSTGQKRASITQYTGGSLFRYVDNGFCTDVELKQRDEAKFAAHCKARQQRWENGLNLWSKFDGGLLS